MKWQHALTDYKYYLKIERGLSQNSIDNYAMDVQKLICFLEEHKSSLNPIEIKKDTIQQFIYHISKSVNPRSQSRIISGLRSFFNYLVFDDFYNHQLLVGDFFQD